MKLNEISPPPGAVKRKKRLGRGVGSGRGKTAGKGSKGQNCRSGGGVPPWFEGGQMPLQRRLPKRGFSNKFRATYQVVNIGDLDRFEKGERVNRLTLREKGLIEKVSRPVKILGDGEISIALELEVDAVSGSARKAISEAGGSVTIMGGEKPRGKRPEWARKRKKTGVAGKDKKVEKQEAAATPEGGDSEEDKVNKNEKAGESTAKEKEDEEKKESRDKSEGPPSDQENG